MQGATVAVFDHLEHTVTVAGPSNASVNRCTWEMTHGPGMRLLRAPNPANEPEYVDASMDDATYIARVRRAQEHISAGELKEIVLARTFRTPIRGADPIDIYRALRVLSPDTCRPFSRDRRGLVLGEGAATLVLESLEHASARQATLFGELCGCAMTSDAHHILSPSLQGQAEAIRACLRDAGLDTDHLAYVNAHGTATAANDVTETRALRQALGDAADRLQVSSTKSMHGHTLGAGGAIEVLATLVALQERFAPPTMNYTESDPDCDLNYVPNETQELRRGHVALSNSFAFGGHNAVIAMRAAAHV